MYGLVNKALEQMLVEDYGKQKWDAIKDAADINDQIFISNISYPDELTYNIIGTASSELNVEAKTLLYNFGRFWVLRTGTESYGELFKSAGSSLREFLINLPDFHARVMLYYPNLTPPTFYLENIKDASLDLHYMSHRHGLTEFVRGLIDGLAELYATPIAVETLEAFDGPMAHDTFHIKFVR